MSPTATIITVVLGLVLVAWLFQSDTRDPGYEAWLKQQQEQKKANTAQRASLGIAVTDAGVTKDTSTTTDRNPRPVDIGTPEHTATPSAGGPEQVNPSGANNPDLSSESAGTRGVFGNNAHIEGAYVGVAYAGSVAHRSLAGDEPAITFRRDGTFTTQNMGQAEVDFEIATAAGSSRVDRGSGRYRLSGTTLTLTFTDGLTRKEKGNTRTYVMVPLGNENAPAGITIQGKLFKRMAQ